MADSGAVLDALHRIGERATDDMSERDVENLFLETGFYDALDYEGTGEDIRSEFTLPDQRRPDYLTLDSNERVTAVYEFKTTGRDLGDHTGQLFGYMDDLRADYGVLTNGESLRLYRSGQERPVVSVALGEVSDRKARDLVAALRKRTWSITDPDDVDEYLATLDPISLDGELGKDHFFDTFRLEAGSPFADLVTAMMDLLVELRDEREAKFVKGAYDFWDASYASEPDETPDSWDDLVGDGSLHDFMFCLESGHALLSRLLLAKACEDRDFFPRGTGLREYLREIQGFGSEIVLDAYPVAADGLLEEMRNQLVESLFEDDIFIWWIDAYNEETASLHGDPYSRFRDVARGGSEIDRVSPATRERFSRAVAQVFFSVLKFDLAEIRGDPLGDLYQEYFDPETRKALGEFYTPQEVVEYIMDGVEYDVGVSQERLMDPATGSGTFLVEAVSRYLDDVRRYHDDPDWQEHLTDLCSRPAVVGLDVHPFAVLMAQIRFMIEILPEYREAKAANPSFTIRRLPIFRTDALRNEREATGLDLGDDSGRQLTFDSLTEDNQDVLIPVPLPVEVDEDDVCESERDGDFLVQQVRMPLFDTIQLETGVSNFGEYFAALQGVLDVVKFHMRNGEYEYGGGLRAGIDRYTTRKYDGVEEFFAPYVDDILSTVRYLREDHGDGRLFKMFEDSVLALVVKNYIDYDYVVGNPPYVRVQNLPDEQKTYLNELYDSTTGNYDLYCPFYERGIEWLTEGSGRLGYITPNQFFVTDYGEGTRRELLRYTRIEEVYDFRDSGVFEDATNYPAIVVLRDEPEQEARESNQIRNVRVKTNVGDDTGRELDHEIIESVRDHRDEPGYSDEYIDVFDFPQGELDEGYWSLMPPEELQVFKKLETEADSTLDGITDSVFAGTQTSANKVYIVSLVNAGRIEPESQGETVRVVPSGEDREYEIETDLLRPWLDGKDIQRWGADWSGQHVILPYHIDNDGGVLESTPFTAEELQEDLPLTWEYFKEHQEKLESREGGRMDGRDDWFTFIYPKSHDRFENSKTIGAHIAENARFMVDESGEWYFKTAYGIQFDPEYRDRTKEFAGQLNSAALDFYFKHITTVKQGGFYEYRAQYLELLPCHVEDQDGEFSSIRGLIDRILASIETENKADRFPEAYIGTFDGELGYLEYEWQTRRSPVSADIQELADGRFAVQAGRTDEITDPLMDQGDRVDKKRRARYVLAAVDGRKVKSGEEVTIPIPRRDEDVQALLDELETDRRQVEETDIEALEAEIDEAVYDLFDLTEDEREVIEDYLEVF